MYNLYIYHQKDFIINARTRTLVYYDLGFPYGIFPAGYSNWRAGDYPLDGVVPYSHWPSGIYFEIFKIVQISILSHETFQDDESITVTLFRGLEIHFCSILRYLQWSGEMWYPCPLWPLGASGGHGYPCSVTESFPILLSTPELLVKNNFSDYLLNTDYAAWAAVQSHDPLGYVGIINYYFEYYILGIDYAPEGVIFAWNFLWSIPSLNADFTLVKSY